MFNTPLFGRSVFTLLLIIAHLGIGSCASTQAPLSPESRMQLGHVGVIALSSTPRVEFHTFAKGWAAGAAKGGAFGAVDGLLAALAELGRNPPTGQFAGPMTLITLAVLIAVHTTVYGVAGGLEAVPSKTAQESEQELKAAIGDVNLANELAQKVGDSSVSREELQRYGASYLGMSLSGTSSYSNLSRQGIDTVAEVQITDAGFRGGSGSQPKVSFYLNARIRLLSTHTGMEIYSRDFQFLSRERLFVEWFADGSRELLSGFTQAMDSLAGRIVDELFIVTNFPFGSGFWAIPGSPEFGSCWFYPIHPELKYTSLWYSMRHNMPGIHIRYTEVDSLQPIFRWESFPRPRDRSEDNASLLSTISDVTYDLKIWEASGDFPERLVCDISGIREPQYRPASPLKPATKYFWTFRARYKHSGQFQATRWAFSNIPSSVPYEYPQRPPGGTCNLDAIPSTNYYRFITP